MEDHATPAAVRPNDLLGLVPKRAAFERYFAESRKSKGKDRRPTFERLADGTYADDHTQRHWWTWQQAMAAERERWRVLLEARAAGCERAAENTEDPKFDAMARVLMSVREDGSKA